MDKQAKEARDMAKALPLRDKISHIWTYYKWWIICTVVAVLIIVSTVYEVLTRPTYDLEIAYYSDVAISDEMLVTMEEYFAQFVEDTDGNGQKNVKIYNACLSLGGNDPTAQMAIQSKLVAELSAKSYPVFILDDAFIELMQKEFYEGALDEFRDLSEYPELKEKFNIEDGKHVYWGTRAVYPAEADDEKRIEEYNRTLETEVAIFGERK